MENPTKTILLNTVVLNEKKSNLSLPFRPSTTTDFSISAWFYPTPLPRNIESASKYLLIDFFGLISLQLHFETPQPQFQIEIKHKNHTTLSKQQCKTHEWHLLVINHEKKSHKCKPICFKCFSNLFSFQSKFQSKYFSTKYPSSIRAMYLIPKRSEISSPLVIRLC